jgi:hypothetical protein
VAVSGLLHHEHCTYTVDDQNRDGYPRIDAPRESNEVFDDIITFRSLGIIEIELSPDLPR